MERPVNYVEQTWEEMINETINKSRTDVVEAANRERASFARSLTLEAVEATRILADSALANELEGTKTQLRLALARETELRERLRRLVDSYDKVIQRQRKQLEVIPPLEYEYGESTVVDADVEQQGSWRDRPALL